MNIDRIFAALADPVRMALCELMAKHDGSLCVDELIMRINERFERDLAQSTISAHLRILRNAGLVDYRKKGLWAYYHFEQATFNQALSLARLRLASGTIRHNNEDLHVMAAR